MVTVTPEDRERATEVIERIDAAPAEPGSEPVVTSNTEVAHGIIATGIAEAREDATGPADCSAVETQLALTEEALNNCHDEMDTLRSELIECSEARAKLKIDLDACRAGSPGDCSEVEKELAETQAELEQAKNAIEGMSLKVRVFNHTALGLTAMLNIHAQEANAQAEAQKAAEAMAQAQGDVVENSQGDKPTRK